MVNSNKHIPANQIIVNHQNNEENGQRKLLVCSCGKKFIRQHHFQKHLKTHEKGNKKIDLTCSKCFKKFADTKTKKLHEKTEHKSSELKKCKFCSSAFESLDKYLKHIESVHQDKKKNCFMCSVCGKQYKTKTELTHHINSKCGTLRQFKCKICEQELMSAGSLYNHMLRHNGERSFMCRFCAKLFFTAGQLKVHERIHTQDKAYVCEVCNKGFCHRQSLITHSTLHTGIKPYQCENCGNSFSCVGNLIKHRKTHADTCGLVPLTTHRVKHPSTKIKVKINTPANARLKMREKDVELKKELDTLKTELNKNKTDNTSEVSESQTNQLANENTDVLICKLEVSIQENLLENEIKLETFSQSDEDNKQPTNEIEHSEPDMRHPDENSCDQNVEFSNDNSGTDEEDFCPADMTQENKTDSNFTIKKKSSHKKHIKKDPSFEKMLRLFSEEINFDQEGYGDCKYCGKRYMNVRWLYKHIKNHENNVPNGADDKSGVPLHKCSCCKKSFYTKEESLDHQQTTHADLLTCQECEKIFANRDSLRSHQKVFHKGFGRKAYLYICEKCGKQFKQKSYLKCHEERNCDKGPFFECSICKKQFSSKHTRNNHMRIHEPEKKLLCKFCAKSFHWKGQLKIHERSHTGEKPFACLYCPKAFAYRESLITHSTIHTGIKPHLCEKCGSRFSCIGNLIKHRNSHASECGAWPYKTQKLDQENADNFALNQSLI